MDVKHALSSRSLGRIAIRLDIARNGHSESGTLNTGRYEANTGTSSRNAGFKDVWREGCQLRELRACGSA